MRKLITMVGMLSISLTAFGGDLDGLKFCRSVDTGGMFGQPKGARNHCVSFNNNTARDNGNTFFGNPPESFSYKVVDGKIVNAKLGKQSGYEIKDGDLTIRETGAILTASILQDEIIKSCLFVVKAPFNKEVFPTVYQIVRNEDYVVSVRSYQSANGQLSELPAEAVAISEYSVRANLKSSTPNMNTAESLIVGTMGFLKDPALASAFSVGLKLESIRHAKVYQIGKTTHMGGMVIIEARDKDGKDMGSFVTGFFPFACVAQDHK